MIRDCLNMWSCTSASDIFPYTSHFGNISLNEGQTSRYYLLLYYTLILLFSKLNSDSLTEWSKILTNSIVWYVEIKCQLDATDDFYCRSYCVLNMFRAPLCPSSGAREYYTGGCLPVVFGALVFKLSVWCGAECYVSGLWAAAVAHKPDT